MPVLVDKTDTTALNWIWVHDLNGLVCSLLIHHGLAHPLVQARVDAERRCGESGGYDLGVILTVEAFISVAFDALGSRNLAKGEPKISTLAKRAPRSSGTLNPSRRGPSRQRSPLTRPHSPPRHRNRCRPSLAP